MAYEDLDNDPVLAKKRLIVEDIDKWQLTDAALNQGPSALKSACGKIPSTCEMIDYYIVGRLRAEFPIVRTLMGEPPGSRGASWVMNNVDGNNTYIKLKIEQDGIYDTVWVISCHTSKNNKVLLAIRDCPAFRQYLERELAVHRPGPMSELRMQPEAQNLPGAI